MRFNGVLFNKMAGIDLVDNLKLVHEKMEAAIQRRRKHPQNLICGTPRLVCVSKKKSVNLILMAYRTGERHFGENYLNELIEKATDPDILSECKQIKWHFIGHLQSNKVSKIVTIPALFIVETVDSEKIASALDKAWSGANPEQNLNVYIQINTSEEPGKNGISPCDVVKLVKHVMEQCPHLNFKGLMTIGQFGHDPIDGTNPDFLSLVRCQQNVINAFQLPLESIELSMGMSADFEHAIECGSTNVRVGTDIFGLRPKKLTK